jgi:hypothetical protein
MARRPVGAMLQFEFGLWRALCLAMMFVLLASLAHGPSAARIDLPGKLAVVSASAPAGEPCGPSHGGVHDHALCCSSASCPTSAAVDVVFELPQAARTGEIAQSDLNFSSHAAPALFHPPKLLVVA